MSFNTSYTDTGLFGVYAVSDNLKNLGKRVLGGGEGGDWNVYITFSLAIHHTQLSVIIEISFKNTYLYIYIYYLDDLIHYIQREWHRLAINVTAAEVFRAKNQLKTSLLLSLDGTTPIAEDIG